MKASSLPGALTLTLALAGCNRGGAEPAAAPPPAAIHVDTVVAKEQPMPRGLPLTGQLIANQQADVAANASGLVTKTFVERGTFVAKGSILAQLDVRQARMGDDEARSNLESARTAFKLAESQCARNQQLFDKGAISRDEWERYESQCKTSKAQAAAAETRVRMAEKSISDGTVRAPFAGMVAERYVSIGEYVQPSTKVANVVELDPLRLQLSISEADIGQIKQGQEVEFDVQSAPGENFKGVIRYIGPAVRAASRDLLVEAVVRNGKRRLRPGMFATAHLRLAETPQVVVPKTAVRADGSTTRLFAVVDGHIEERVVQAGTERDGMVAITEGLKAGEKVIAQPSPAIKDGLPVN